ncbi:MAG TPA: 4Fe-4S dicluster domain-containing protein [Humidesulfovibrio sp.]|uniref:4Fe-4S dicluster domain-containing protein n=1 Tax=Humidesulfovibrio sp. TaxID=2910988 RepID=UPI002C13E919|nr:4Fe-4S dicluster domain-containing protein [Humidesulfovibrio sp.]HWR02875.1 4Fe-4S dicluster domain-containing protein [Humidesulfovibrio sp.]
MSNGKSFLVDLTKCTACRGCQIACKQWKKLPGEKTKNTGSHQNPPDFSYNTLRVVRFSEKEVDGQIKWFFTPDQCRHCLEAPCKTATEQPDAIVIDEQTGAVVYSDKTAKESFDAVQGICPYDVPRMDKKTKIISKCDMCNDRVKAGKRPACVTSCPTGTMNFGDRDDMLKLAEVRLAEAKKKYPKAQLVDADSVRVIFLTADAPNLYAKNLMADAGSLPGKNGYTRQELFAALRKPVKNLLG